MRNKSVKVLRTEKGELFLFYSDGESILQKKYERGAWSRGQAIIRSVEESISLWAAEDNIYILCRGTDGDIYFCKKIDDAKWERRVIYKDTGGGDISSDFYFFANKSVFNLIYTIRGEDAGKKGQKLMHTSFTGGNWSMPFEIDRIAPLENTSFIAEKPGEGGVALYYKCVDGSFCSREVKLSPLAFGRENTFVKSGPGIRDISVLSDGSSVYTAYVLRSMFSVQIVFRQKSGDELLNPIMVWEGPRAEDCLLFMSEGILYISWTTNGIAYFSRYDQSRGIFSMPQRARDGSPGRRIKGEYIDLQGVPSFQSREIFVSGEGAWDIQIPAFLRDGFFKDIKDTPVIIMEEKKEAPEKDPENKEKLRNRLEEYQKQSTQRENEIASLSKMLGERNEDILQINSSWRNKYAALEKETQAARNEAERLRAEIMMLRSEMERQRTEAASIRSAFALPAEDDEPGPPEISESSD